VRLLLSGGKPSLSTGDSFSEGRRAAIRMFAGLAVGFKRTAVFVIDGLESRAMAPWLRGGLVNARTSRYRRRAPTVALKLASVGVEDNERNISNKMSRACVHAPSPHDLAPLGRADPSS
jgi:hypothetical protein